MSVSEVTREWTGEWDGRGIPQQWHVSVRPDRFRGSDGWTVGLYADDGESVVLIPMSPAAAHEMGVALRLAAAAVERR